MIAIPQTAAESAERSLLGAVLVEPSVVIPRVEDRVSAEDFSKTLPRIAWLGALKMFRSRGDLDPSLLRIELDPMLRQLGFLWSDVMEFVGEARDVANAEAYADMVRRDAKRRRAIALLNNGGPDSIDDAAAILADPVRGILDDPFVYASSETEPGPQRWVIHEWLPEAFPSTLYGHAGTSKSFVSLFFGTSIALGRPIFGRPVMQGPVLYLDGELDRDTWLRRAYMLARGLDIEKPPPGLVYMRVEDSLLQPGTRGRVLDWIKANKPVLTVIDSYGACLPGKEVNNPDEVGGHMRSLRPFGTCLIVDHAAKAADMTKSSTPLGSVAKKNESRSMFQIASTRSGASVVKHEKANFAKLSEPVAYELTIGGGMARVTQLDYSDDRLHEIEAALPASKRIINAFRAGIVEGGASYKQIAEALDIPERTVRNKAGDLIKSGDLVKDGKFLRLAPPRPPLPFQAGGKDQQ
ncbi:MAG: AAA family ATPase [Thermoanaerobaculia bacterium]